MEREELMMNMRFGLLNYLRTGNMVLDIVIASSIPMFLDFLRNNVPLVLKWLRSLFQKKVFSNYKTMRFVMGTDIYGCKTASPNGLPEVSTSIFFKAVLFYIQDYGLIEETNNTQAELVSSAHNPVDFHYTVPKWQQCKDNRFCMMPMENQWCKVKGYDVEIRFSSRKVDIEKYNSSSTNLSRVIANENILEFRSRSRETLSKLVKVIYDAYLERVRMLENQDKNKYLYVVDPVIASNGRFKSHRYKLTLSKSFDNVFFPLKDDLVKILDNFQEKSGLYGIKGYPHKLGFLLHGEPGTGKTSLIKAIAKHTDRHIVMVGLDRIKTNAQFLDLMFKPHFEIDDYRNGPTVNTYKLQPKDCVFVFEDIDTYTDLVLSRKDNNLNGAGINNRNENGKYDRVQELMLMNMVAMNSKNNKNQKDSQAENFMLSQEDKLSLGGILNVLDGPLEVDGRIIIFTTNHPEKLDSALIRPGRIDHVYHLTYAVLEDIFKMIELYFETCEEKTKEKLKVLVESTGLQITPATVEVLAVQSKDQDMFVERLTAFANSQTLPDFQKLSQK